MLHALERFSLTTKAEKDPPFQVEQILFRHPGTARHRAATQNRRKLLANKVAAVAPSYFSSIQGLVSYFPGGLALRAACFGVLGVVMFGPGVLLPLWALGINEFTPTGYAVFKGFWAGAMAAVLEVPMVLLALRED